jgi:hypothetical protein
MAVFEPDKSRSSAGIGRADATGLKHCRGTYVNTNSGRHCLAQQWTHF